MLKEKAMVKVREGYFNREVGIVLYRKPSSGNDGRIHYSEMNIRSDDDVRAMMETHGQFSRVGTMELYVSAIQSLNNIIFLLQQNP